MSHSRIVYISIGNSDDKLSQYDWSIYWNNVNNAIESLSTQIHGVWLSESQSQYQNACWCVELDEEQYEELKHELGQVGTANNQDSIAWAVAETEFI